MKGLGKALIFIFTSLCVMVGLAINKLYDKYVHKNFFTGLAINFIVFLAILRLSLFLITPLAKSILTCLHIKCIPFYNVVVTCMCLHPLGFIITIAATFCFVALLKTIK